MPQDPTDTQHSTTGQPHADVPASDAQRQTPAQPDADSARPPHGYDDPLRRERNSGLVPPDSDAEQQR